MSKKACLGKADRNNPKNGLFGDQLQEESCSGSRADFAVQHADHALGELRFSLWLSLLVYSVFTVVDFYALPEKMGVLLLIRFAGYLPLCLLTLFLSRTTFFRCHMQPLMFLFSFLGSVGLVAIYAIAALEGVFVYRYALFFMVVFLYALLRLRFGWATLTGWLLFACFNLVMFRYRPSMPEVWQGTGDAAFFPLDQWNEEWLNIALMLLFFNLFGMTMSWFREREEWHSFSLNRLLEKKRVQVEEMNYELETRVQQRTLLFEDANTTLREMNNKLEYLSYHDPLTGLYNRRFFEEEVKRLDVPRNYPLSMLMADVNGLKLINDSFGHAMGDRILCAAANAMKAACRSDDILARLGGDEFVMLMPGTEESDVEALVERMRSITAIERVGSLELSVSFGYATKRDEGMKAQEVFSMAEDRMYHRKLTESPAMRGRTIRTILATLHGRNEQEQLHAQRVSELCGSMGKAMDLNETQVRELEMVGLFHDIGKIAIHDDLLNKTEPLTSGEWEDFKRHAEIGYRMLSTVNELADMAESVLAHHERWDGGGYPKGIAGDEIPLSSRIIAIADSFDAVTGKRVYHQTRTNAEAIDEMRQQAGKHFDPALLSLFLEKCV